MAPRKNQRPLEDGSSAKQEMENVTSVATFDDNHAATEDAMLAAHAKQLQECGLIDEKQVAEFTKPFRYRAQHYSNYTTSYLAMHPAYTGQNHDAMPTLETARMHQKARDIKMLRLLDDYRNGRVDLDGNPVVTETDYGRSDVASESRSGIHSRYLKTPPLQADDDISGKTHQPTSMIEKPSHGNSESQLMTSKLGSTKSTITNSRSITESRPTRKKHIEPQEPLSGELTYEGIDYYDLVAICRKRKLKRGGCAEEVRNCLIRDDRNIAEGKPWEQVRKPHSRKSYKRTAPTSMLL